MRVRKSSRAVLAVVVASAALAAAVPAQAAPDGFNPGRPDHDQPHWRLATYTYTYTFTASDRITHLGFESLVSSRR